MNEVKAPAINPKLIKFAEHQRNLHRIEVPPGIDIGNLERSEFWAHCTKNFKVYDKVEARAQDNAWYAELLVTGVGKLEVSMVVVLYKDLSARVLSAEAPAIEKASLPSVPPRPAALVDAPADIDAPFLVKFGGADKWRVIRTLDNAVMHKGEASREAAQSWLDNYLADKAKA